MPTTRSSSKKDEGGFLEVIGAGCGRTATSSLREALRELGYSPYHMTTCMDNGDAAKWNAAATGDDDALRAIFTDYTATTDFPASMFFEELLRLNPKARVVLSVRDPKKWCQSVRDTIWSPFFMERHWFWRPIVGGAAKEMFAMYKERLFGTKTPDYDDDAFLIDAFEKHSARVKKVVPSSQLLVHDASDGWAPLCAFLGKPVPSTPYPRLNDTASFQTPILVCKTFLVLAPVLLAIAVAMLGKKLLM